MCDTWWPLRPGRSMAVAFLLRMIELQLAATWLVWSSQYPAWDVTVRVVQQKDPSMKHGAFIRVHDTLYLLLVFFLLIQGGLSGGFHTDFFFLLG